MKSYRRGNASSQKHKRMHCRFLNWFIEDSPHIVTTFWTKKIILKPMNDSEMILKLPGNGIFVSITGLIEFWSTQSAPFFPRPLDVTTSNSGFSFASSNCSTLVSSSSPKPRSPIVMLPIGAIFKRESQTYDLLKFCFYFLFLDLLKWISITRFLVFFF